MLQNRRLNILETYDKMESHKHNNKNMINIKLKTIYYKRLTGMHFIDLKFILKCYNHISSVPMNEVLKYLDTVKNFNPF